MRILSKKLIIALMAISMATFPALNANAQAGAAGGIAGVGATTAIIIGVVVVGAVAANNNDSGRPTNFAPIPETPASPTTTTTTAGSAGGSTTTTTTTTN
jgi:hypothetical protein